MVSEGNASLWSAVFEDPYYANPFALTLTSSNARLTSFERSERDGQVTLTFLHEGRQGGTHIRVETSVQSDRGPGFTLSAQVNHLNGPRLDWFSLPAPMTLATHDIAPSVATPDTRHHAALGVLPSAPIVDRHLSHHLGRCGRYVDRII